MKHFKIMGRIVLLFSIVMLMSFIPENNREFFGDWHCDGHNLHEPTWHWGFRHYMWMLMGLALFIYNAVLIVIKLDTKSR